MGVLFHVLLPTEKPMSQAVAQMSKTIQSSRWMIAGTRALPSIISVNTMSQRPSLVRSHTIFVVKCPRGGLLSGKRLSREPLLSARR
jgi:hypothetical protein